MKNNIDVATTSSKTEDRGKRWVEIPERDLFDFPFPAIRVNLDAYEPGQKYFVDAEVADTIEERLLTKYNADLQIMQPRQQKAVVDTMNRWGIGRSSGAFTNNPDALR